MIVVVAALGWASPMFLIVCAQNHRIACCRCLTVVSVHVVKFGEFRLTGSQTN
ncbi:hypothetical protein PF005_g28479 [Phytophthora fragariae]|uniref:Uncharacterized protein n=2 Tax=Phytophthora TaxID=4783 RepID=A0A6A4BUY4_9STRA|nr:hypothetical protein PF003_g16183 [Phytophthora fragariae]KAE8952915.1 hypothetical protein PR001_g33096 [Phytophthora rubi]KAE8940028.1 hypothetical protein PF009_g10142 [Phytophthora fragariae]KAE8952933.1 hypothetical protein PR002_g32533 [Phytophthora rubi]KAE8990034.1 hypothetical protein PF011_g18526 [Phytophthora fragariae]